MVIPSANDILAALGGGALIGLAASAYLWSHGRVAGISGVLASLFAPGDRATRAVPAAFIGGLVLAGLVLRGAAPHVYGDGPGLGTALLAGALVGVGTRLGNGCTSGHGVCGISRGSVRSVVATLVFIATGAATVLALRALGVSP